MSTEVLQHETIPAPPELTLRDRCDGCGAQAFVRVTLLEGDLLFCGHDWKKPGVQEKIKAVAVTIQDELWRLTQNTKPEV